MLIHTLLPTLCALTSLHAAEDALRRQIKPADGHFEYVVGRRAPTLYMISRDLFGSEAKWSDLAEWNALVAPYHVERGQTLSVRLEPTLTEGEGDEVLAKAWSRLGNADLATRLRRSAREPAEEKSPAPAPEPVTGSRETAPINASVVAAPAEVISEPAAAAPSEVAPTLTSTPVPTPMPLPNLDPEEDKPATARPWRWQWRADLTGSLFQLANRNGIYQNDLYSRANYGLEVEALYRAANAWGIGAYAATERVNMESAKDGVPFRQNARDFVRAGVITRARPLDALAVHAAVAASQRPLPLVTARGLALYSVVLPEVTLGADLPIAGGADVSAALVVEGLWSAAVNDRHFRVKSGYGGQAGIRLEVPIGQGARMTVTPRYRYLREDTRDARNVQQAGTLNLGVTW